MASATYVNCIPSRMFDSSRPFDHQYQPYQYQHHYEPYQYPPSRRSMLWRPKTEYLNKTNKNKKKRFLPLELKVPSPPVNNKPIKPLPIKVKANVNNAKVTPLYPFSVLPRPHPLKRSPAIELEEVGRSMVDEQRQQQQINDFVERNRHEFGVTVTILDWMRISNAQVVEENRRRTNDKTHLETCDQISCDLFRVSDEAACDQIMKK